MSCPNTLEWYRRQPPCVEPFAVERLYSCFTRHLPQQPSQLRCYLTSLKRSTHKAVLYDVHIHVLTFFCGRVVKRCVAITLGSRHWQPGYCPVHKRLIERQTPGQWRELYRGVAMSIPHTLSNQSSTSLQTPHLHNTETPQAQQPSLASVVRSEKRLWLCVRVASLSLRKTQSRRQTDSPQRRCPSNRIYIHSQTKPPDAIILPSPRYDTCEPAPPRQKPCLVGFVTALRSSISDNV